MPHRQPSAAALEIALAPAIAALRERAAPPARIAFFDVDRTLIRRSSMFAITPALRRHGLVGWGSALRAAAMHAVYLVRGVTARELEAIAGEGFAIMRGWREAAVAGVVTAELERLGALAYPDVIGRVRAHQERGEACVAISASLREVVVPLAARLGLDAAIGSVAETGEGRFTGRAVFFCHGAAKAAAATALCDAVGLDVRRSAAYSDSATDRQLLEAVGEPVAVNPDRRLRRLARDRAWPTLEVS